MKERNAKETQTNEGIGTQGNTKNVCKRTQRKDKQTKGKEYKRNKQMKAKQLK